LKDNRKRGRFHEGVWRVEKEKLQAPMRKGRAMATTQKVEKTWGRDK